MIQPEPEDLPKDNPKLEIAVLRYEDGKLSQSSSVIFIATCSYSSFKDSNDKDESSDQTKIHFRSFDNQELPQIHQEATISQTSLQQPVVEIEPLQLEEPEPTLEDEFQDLHLNLLVLEVLAHARIYNAILDKYVESLELGKNRSAFVQGEVPAKMEDPGLFTLPCRLGDSKPFDTLADLGSCINIIPLYLFKNLNIGLLEETDHIFGLANET
ncbi:hypothetical protein Tco_1181633 [Tanacetum coccineum]